MIARFCLLMAAVVCAWAQTGLDRPRLGQMLDSRGAVRPVFGVGGSFTLGDPLVEGVVSTACARALCLAKTDASILSAGTQIAAPPGPAFIAIDGDAAVLYFPEVRQFARWRAGLLTQLDVNSDGEVLSLRANLDLAVRSATGVWIVSQSGSVIDALPDNAGAVLLLPDAVLFATPEELVLRRADGTEARFQSPGVNQLFAMGEDYVQARAGAITYALRIRSGAERLFVLPQTAVPRKHR